MVKIYLHCKGTYVSIFRAEEILVGGGEKVKHGGSMSFKMSVSFYQTT